MKLTFDEKKILYTWGCPVYKNTVTRLAFAAAYMTDNDAKHCIAMFRDKLMKKYLERDEVQLLSLTESTLTKLATMTDEEFGQLELYPDFDI